MPPSPTTPQLQTENEDPSLTEAALREQARLWVDKHAPSSVTDLLSSELTTRNVCQSVSELL